MHAPYKFCIKYARTCISCIRFAYMHMCIYARKLQSQPYKSITKLDKNTLLRSSNNNTCQLSNKVKLNIQVTSGGVALFA